MDFLLASASPRRQELLKTFAFPFSIKPVDADESLMPGEDSREAVSRLAALKADTALAQIDDAWVLAADTLVGKEKEIFSKPLDRNDAANMLRRLSGDWHHVDTAIVLANKATRYARTVRTRVHFRDITDQELEHYLDLGEYTDKAGSYGIQGAAAIFVDRIEGSYSNVVGLPLAELGDVLTHAGIAYWQGAQ